MKHIIPFCLFVFAFGTTQAQVKLPGIIRDSMILQRDVPAKIWGWASPKEKIRIIFNKKNYTTRADEKGNWSLLLPPTAAGGPYIIEIQSKNKITLREILFGEVWFFSGQSNMVHQLNIHDVTYATDIAEANYPSIRQFWIPTLTNLQGPQADIKGTYWKSAVGEEVRPFSAVAYFFALKIHKKYNVPVGIINSSVGGTPIDAWMSEEGLQDFPTQLSRIARNKDTGALSQNTRPPTTTGTRPAPPIDLGLTEQPNWYAENYQPKGWRNMNIPGYWEDQGIRDLNGVVWFRREITLPASVTTTPARLFLGRIVDADELYINGKKAGGTGYQYPQRRYHIPAGLLKAGKNLIVIRVTNNSGKGGFVPDKPYELVVGNDTIDLKGYWQYKVGSVFKPVSGRGFGGAGINAQGQPAALYNAMVAPIAHYTIKGICWYQGETDTGRPQEYKKLMNGLIHDWRARWKNNNLPFLYVQLPGFMDYNYLPVESNWAMLREAQLQTLSIPNTAMAVAIDLGEWNDIHPDNKKDVGERLALAALNKAYQEKLVYSGPLFDTAMVTDSQIQIKFNHTGNGLMTIDGEAPAEFAIAGEDKKFVWAKTRLEADKVIVWSDEVPAPKYVRYAWSDNPVNPNLYNKEGLPASPFRTDK